MKFITHQGQLWDPEERSLENPQTPLSDPDDWLFTALGSTRSESGVRISHRSAMMYSAVWRGVSLLSRDVSKLPCITYRRQGMGKERDTGHPAYRLLKRRPNDVMTPQQFLMAMMIPAVLRGNSFALIVRRNDGTPDQVVPVNNDRVQVETMDGQLVYWFIPEGTNERQAVASANLIHIKGPGDGLEGMSMIAHAANTVGLGIGSLNYSARFFRNSSRPAAILEHPGKMTPEAAKRLRESFESVHRGTDNAHKTAILEEGMKLTPWALNAEEAQLLETRKFQLIDVANFLNLPPHKVGSDARTAYASLEEENQSYLDEGLDPWLVTMEQEFERKLLSPRQQEQDTHVIEFLRQALVRANLKSRGEFYSMMLNSGIMSPDEIRGRENLNPQDGGVGDVYFRPLNIQQVGPGAVEEPEPAPAPIPEPTGAVAEIVAEANRAMIAGQVRRMVRRLGLAARKAAKHPDGFIAWLDGLVGSDHEQVIADALREPVEAARASLAAVSMPMASDTDASRAVLDGFKERMLRAAEVTSYDLAGSVDEAAVVAEDAMGSEIARYLTELN